MDFSDRPTLPSVPPRRVVTELPGPKAREWMARGGFDMQSRYRAVVMDDSASRGCSLVDVDGNVFLDLFANFALGALGYNHPALVEAAHGEAFHRAVANPTSTPFVTTPAWFEFVEALEQRYAPRGMARVFCVDAGGEGVESALKAAFIRHGERRREAAGLPKNPLELPEEQQSRILDNAGTDAVVVSFSGAFHGRGLGPMSATHSKVIHKADLPAFPWPAAPFPASRFPLARYAAENDRAEAEALAALERILDAHEGRVAALIVEPVQSEGGDRHASPVFFRRVQELAGKAGAAFVLDEVQTGLGISGTLWAHEQLDLPRPPDLVCFGKKMQMGGFFATAAYDVAQFGRMYQTRNGDRARAAVALATLRAIESEDLLANVRATGRHFLSRLEELCERYPALVSEPRGRGFLLAFDLPTTAARDDFLGRTLRRGVFASYTGTRSVRLRPHLITTTAEVDEAATVFDAVLREMAG
ncbi:aminotransferase class III-fold pyridoxal phosphate-dependent enzyme [Sorangium sp. So ce1097]|uniref:aminotransferase class III-fold pyridoxal phosphate-dependent enzyme n=1 Tax=Sorangium sp. So ce1097 TaxID=3133330 RepID=UPI003F5E5977